MEKDRKVHGASDGESDGSDQDGQRATHFYTDFIQNEDEDGGYDEAEYMSRKQACSSHHQSWNGTSFNGMPIVKDDIRTSFFQTAEENG